MLDAEQLLISTLKGWRPNLAGRWGRNERKEPALGLYNGVSTHRGGILLAKVREN